MNPLLTPLNKEMIPSLGIPITSRPDYKIRRVTLQTEGNVLDLRPTPGGSWVTAPRLAVQTMAVADLEEKR